MNKITAVLIAVAMTLILGASLLAVFSDLKGEDKELRQEYIVNKIGVAYEEGILIKGPYHLIYYQDSGQEKSIRFWDWQLQVYKTNETSSKLVYTKKYTQYKYRKENLNEQYVLFKSNSTPEVFIGG